MTNKNKADKGISRIDSGSTHGWFVRGYRNGKTFSKLFSDIKCGSKENALEEARTYRNDLHNNLESVPKAPRARRIVTRDSRNSTGVLGVCRTTKKGLKGKLNECYSVSWRPAPGIQKCTSFSIHKYGEKKAFELAVAFRRAKLEEIHPPEIVDKMLKAQPILKQVDPSSSEKQED